MRLEQTLLQDSNILRQSPNFITDGQPTSDRASVTSVILFADKSSGRQTFEASAGIKRTSFDHHDAYDFTSKSGNANWTLGFGTNNSVTAGYNRAEDQSAFTERGLGTGLGFPNIVTKEQTSLSTRFRTSTDWALDLGVTQLQHRNSDTRLNGGDHNVRSASLEFGLRPKTGNSFTVRYQRSANDYSTATDFSQKTTTFNTHYIVSGSSTADASFGTLHQHSASGSSYDSWTSRVAYVWQFSGASSLNLALSRNRTPVSDADSVTAMTTNADFSVTWKPTAKLGFTPAYSYSRRHYDAYTERNRPPVAVPIDDRHDISRIASLTTSYQPSDTWLFQFRAARESLRSSRSDFYDYTSESYQLTAQFNF